ncbi:response regulator [Paraburkholderia sp. NMBU_R16]|uniref:response regulator n=1 Tax=Paraburkholderia sp. NMBU_R16 TaxID=2698676 RepID=UPI0015642500|nr:response regulator transcription factor [Paraburkholderia sp. NMBU_R16]NRO96928.1 response regulator [Paraburkholderia sp. NMBU_R16]
MIKVLLADDHTVVRQGLRHILETAGDFEVVGEAGDGAAALDLANRVDADVLLLDLSMPECTGLDLISHIREAAPQLRILIVTMHAEQQYVARAFSAGAAGYMTKESAGLELISALKKLATGGVYISVPIAERLAGRLREPGQASAHQRLSRRELDVLRRLARGKSVTEIATELDRSVKTVSTYKQRILEKLKLPHEAALIRYAVRHHLIDAEEEE